MKLIQNFLEICFSFFKKLRETLNLYSNFIFNKIHFLVVNGKKNSNLEFFLIIGIGNLLLFLLYLTGFRCNAYLLSILISIGALILVLNLFLILFIGLKDYVNTINKINEIKKEEYYNKIYYFSFFNSIYFRIFRVCVGLMTLMFLFNFNLKNRFDLIGWFFLEITEKKNFLFFIPLMFVIFVWLVILFDLLFLNIYNIYYLPRILNIFVSNELNLQKKEDFKKPIEANFYSFFFHGGKYYLKSCLIEGGVMTCKILSGACLSGGTMAAIDQNFEHSGFKPLFGYIYTPFYFYTALGGNPKNITPQMMGETRKDLKFIEGEGWLQKWLRANQERTFIYERTLKKLSL